MSPQKFDEQFALAERGYDLSEREWVNLGWSRQEEAAARAVLTAGHPVVGIRRRFTRPRRGLLGPDES